MTELLIRTKWVKRAKSNAVWIIIGTELKELNRFRGQKARSRLKAKAIQGIQQRLDALKPKLPRNARYWNRKKPGEFASLPTTETMAKECGLLKVYRTWFKLGSDHMHNSHRVLEGFMVTDRQGNLKHWVLDPVASDLAGTFHRLDCITAAFMGYLQKFGWPIDKNRLEEVAARA
jgi:hypothetical protein